MTFKRVGMGHLCKIRTLDSWVGISNSTSITASISIPLEYYQSLVQRLKECDGLTFVHRA